MPNVTSLLRNEFSRVARKEARTETSVLKKAASAHRIEIAALKRRMQALEIQVRRLRKAAGKAAPVVTAAAKSSRYSAKSLASQRRRLGLSAIDCGLLVGASAQSIYNWEEGKVRPLSKHLPAIHRLKGM